MTTVRATVRATAASWVAHLRSGGTTPWPAWSPSATDDSLAASDPLPGAAQLELLRLLNADGDRLPPELVDHVVHRPGPGRGNVHLELPWPAKAAAPADEVLRVGAGVLADLTARLPGAEPPRPPSPASPAGRTPTFALDGATVTVADLRAGLAAGGTFEHRPVKRWLAGVRDADPDVLLLVVGPLDQMLHEVWTRRVQEGSARPWARLVTRWAQRDVLPASVEVDRTAAEWSARIGRDRVHVVTTDALEEQVARVLGDSAVAAGLSQPHLPGDPVRLPPAVSEVLRRVNAVLPFVVREPDGDLRRTALVALAQGVGGQVAGAVGGLTVPDEHRGWVEAHAVRLAGALAGCRLHGDPDVLGRRTAAPVRPATGDVLATMVRMIRLADRTARSAPREAG